MIVSKPGRYDDIEAADYHADPCVDPSLSSGIIRILLEQTPAHAWTAHPRLNPDFKPTTKKTFDLGQAVHKLALERDRQSLVVLSFNDYKTKAAQQARDECYAKGDIPILAKDMDRATAMDGARSAFCTRVLGNDPFRTMQGKAEVTLIWRERRNWCRVRVDWLPNDPVLFWDYKSTNGSASPADVDRTFFQNGYDIQAAWYRRGIQRTLDVPMPECRWLFQETSPPYACALFKLDDEAQEWADERVGQALGLWERCMITETWPGYSGHITKLIPPNWVEYRRQDQDRLREEHDANSD